MKKFIEKLFFKISKIVKKFREFILSKKNYSSISPRLVMQFVILEIMIKYLKSYFDSFVLTVSIRILPVILKLGLQIKFAINCCDRVSCIGKNLKNFYLQFFAILFFKYGIIVKEFFEKKYKKLMYKNILSKSILTRLKRLYLAIYVDLFYRQKSAITRIFLAYFYNLFYINCKN
jgi:hypothetical protein